MKEESANENLEILMNNSGQEPDEGLERKNFNIDSTEVSDATVDST